MTNSLLYSYHISLSDTFFKQYQLYLLNIFIQYIPDKIFK